MGPKKKMALKNFLIFLNKVWWTVAQELKIDLNDFFGKNLDLRFLVQKGPEMGPKRGFSTFRKS